MRNKEEYLKNFMKYHKEDGLSLDEAIDKAMAVEWVGEKFIEDVGEDAPQVINFINISRKYTVLDKQIKELKENGK